MVYVECKVENEAELQEEVKGKVASNLARLTLPSCSLWGSN
jgi:hypothetical protein